MTSPAPRTRLSGRLRRGFLTSPAVKVTLFQASAANSEPTIAPPATISTSIQPGPRTDFATSSYRLDVSAPPQGRDEDAEELGEGDGDGGDGAGLDDEEDGPAVLEAPQGAVGLAQVDVLAAGVRHHAGQLGVAQRPHDRHHPGQQPDEQQP